MLELFQLKKEKRENLEQKDPMVILVSLDFQVVMDLKEAQGKKEKQVMQSFM